MSNTILSIGPTSEDFKLSWYCDIALIHETKQTWIMIPMCWQRDYYINWIFADAGTCNFFNFDRDVQATLLRELRWEQGLNGESGTGKNR